MRIYYWSPFLTHVATVDAVKKSILSFEKYSRGKIKTYLINSCGEWASQEKIFKSTKIINLQYFNFHKFLPKTGLIASRLSFLVILIFNLFPLLYILKKKKPEYLIIHLLTFLPLILSPLIYKKTKIILRISGLPELNFFRKHVWRFFAKYIHKITTPSETTKNLLIEKNIFNKKKIYLLRDPIIDVKVIDKNLKHSIDDIHHREKFFLAIGRLTHQKNFKFLIENFSKTIKYLNTKKLYIIGEGEQWDELNLLIKKLKINENVKILKFKKNIYPYIKRANAILSTAHYEDPGFVLIESLFLNKTILSSLCPSGPLDMKKFGKISLFYKINNKYDFKKKLIKIDNLNVKDIDKTLGKKYSKKFTIFSHYQNFLKLLRQ